MDEQACRRLKNTVSKGGSQGDRTPTEQIIPVKHTCISGRRCGHIICRQAFRVRNARGSSHHACLQLQKLEPTSLGSAVTDSVNVAALPNGSASTAANLSAYLADIHGVQEPFYLRCNLRPLTGPLHLSHYSESTVYLLSSGLYENKCARCLPPDAPLQPLVEWAQLKAARDEPAGPGGVDLRIAAAAKPAADGAVNSRRGMQIFVTTPSGKTITIQADYLMSVLEFKLVIQEKTGGLPPKDQRLRHGWRCMEDTDTIGEVAAKTGLSNESNVSLLYRLKGGMFHASSGGQTTQSWAHHKQSSTQR